MFRPAANVRWLLPALANLIGQRNRCREARSRPVVLVIGIWHRDRERERVWRGVRVIRGVHVMEAEQAQADSLIGPGQGFERFTAHRASR
jgi:hypothetical protein